MYFHWLNMEEILNAPLILLDVYLNFSIWTFHSFSTSPAMNFHCYNWSEGHMNFSWFEFNLHKYFLENHQYMHAIMMYIFLWDIPFLIYLFEQMGCFNFHRGNTLLTCLSGESIYFECIKYRLFTKLNWLS